MEIILVVITVSWVIMCGIDDVPCPFCHKTHKTDLQAWSEKNYTTSISLIQIGNDTIDK